MPYNGKIVTPNLPGYVNNRTKKATKSQNFSFLNGYPFETPPEVKSQIQTGLSYEQIARKKYEANKFKPKPFRPGMSEPPLWLKNDKKVLQFSAYFKEAVHESEMENYRVRVCTIFFYMEDGSMHISEPKVENSGVPQGKFVKRHVIRKPDSDESYTLADLNIGKNITIYSRTFHIFDMNASTRAYLTDVRRVNVPPAEDVKLDAYTTKRQDHMMRETGADATIYRGVMMNPMKKFVEAQLGKATNKNLDGFLEFDRKVLRFDCLWDDRARTYGALHKYTMHYYLTDNTVEFIEVHEPNSGFDPFPKLLKRKRLPKETEAYKSKFGENEESEGTAYYHWSDMRIGNHVLVFGRQIKLMNCDNFTREYFQGKGIRLGSGLAYPIVAKMERPKLNPPPHNGIGSEEDSLGSCMSLTPKPPRKDIHKILANNGKTLRFQARLDNSNFEDKDRTFVITFYLADDTVAVYEPPSRNSGIIGGKFLKRQRMKNSRNQFLRAQDFFVGARMDLFRYRFIIEATDNYTLKYMEANRELFPMANISVILSKLTRLFRKLDVRQEFLAHDADGSGSMSHGEFEKMIYKHITSSEITKQEILTLMRYFDADGSGNIDLNEFLAKLAAADDGSGVIDTFKADDYEAAVASADNEDLERGKQLQAMQFFKEMVKGKRSKMIQLYRIADHRLEEKIPTTAVVNIMHELLGMAKRDAERVCKEYYGDRHTHRTVSSNYSQLEISVVPYSAYLALLDHANA